MPQIDTPQNQRSRDTRAAVLDAAWDLLERSGGASMSMSALAAAAGISRQGLYLHFATRGQLFMALFEHIDQALGLEASLRPVLEAPDALAALDAYTVHIASYHSRLVGIVRAIDRSRHDDEDAAAMWAAATGAWYEGSRTITEALAAEGRLVPPWTPATAADLIWTLMSVDVVDDLIRDRGWTTDELAARLSITLRRAFCRVEA